MGKSGDRIKSGDWKSTEAVLLMPSHQIRRLGNQRKQDMAQPRQHVVGEDAEALRRSLRLDSFSGVEGISFGSGLNQVNQKYMFMRGTGGGLDGNTRNAAARRGWTGM